MSYDHLGPRARLRLAKLIGLAARLGQAAGAAAVQAAATTAQLRDAAVDAYRSGVLKAAGDTAQAKLTLAAAAAGLPVDEYRRMLEFHDAGLDAALTTLNDPVTTELEKSLASTWMGAAGREPGWSALYEDPYEPMALHGGYRERPSLITYEMIDAVAYRLGPFIAYTQNRVTKATQYARPQEDRHGVGFIIRKRDERWKSIGGASQAKTATAGTELRKSRACRDLALAFKGLTGSELLRKAGPGDPPQAGQPTERPEQQPAPPPVDPWAAQAAAAPAGGDAAATKTVEVDPRAQELTAILMNCGRTPQEDADGDRRDGFPTFVHKILRDSLFYDQINFEKQRNRKGKLQVWQAVDAKSTRSARRDTDVRNVRGEKVRYAQVIHGVIAAEFSARDLAFRVRNPRTDLRSFGYGLSEIEMAISVVTALLNGFDHNARYFSQGTTAKGILAIHGLVPRGHLTAFKQLWQAMVSGAANAWRTPILNMADEKSSAKWIDIQKSNLDMEWSRFMDYLLKICCAVWQIAPEEIGFQFGNTGQAGGMGEAGQKDKVQAGKDKGLKPLLEWLAQVINEEILWELDPNYEFAFVGMDADSEAAEVELLGKKSATYMTINEVRASQDLPHRDDCEIIRDPNWTQAKNAAAAAQQPGMGGGPPGASPGFDGVDNYAPWDDGGPGQDSETGQPAGPEPAAKSLTARAAPRRLKPRHATVTRYEVAL